MRRQRQFAMLLLAGLSCSRMAVRSNDVEAPADERDARIAAAVGPVSMPSIGVEADGHICNGMALDSWLKGVFSQELVSSAALVEAKDNPLRLRGSIETDHSGGSVQRLVRLQLRDAEDVVVWRTEVALLGGTVDGNSEVRASPKVRPFKPRRNLRPRWEAPPGPDDEDPDDDDGDDDVDVDTDHGAQNLPECNEALLRPVANVVTRYFGRELPSALQRARSMPAPRSVGAWPPPQQIDRLIVEGGQPGAMNLEKLEARGHACGSPGDGWADDFVETLREQKVEAGEAGRSPLYPVVLLREDDASVWVTTQVRSRGNTIVWQRVRGFGVSRWFDDEKKLKKAQKKCARQVASVLVDSLRDFRETVLPAALARLRSGGDPGLATSGVVLRVVVLEFRGDGRLSQAMLAQLSDAARGGAADVVDAQRYMILTRENMSAVLDDIGIREALEGEAELETARNLAANLLVTGELARADGAHLITLKLFDVQSGALLGTESASARREVELVQVTRAATAELLRRARM